MSASSSTGAPSPLLETACASRGLVAWSQSRSELCLKKSLWVGRVEHGGLVGRVEHGRLVGRVAVDGAVPVDLVDAAQPGLVTDGRLLVLGRVGGVGGRLESGLVVDSVLDVHKQRVVDVGHDEVGEVSKAVQPLAGGLVDVRARAAASAGPRRPGRRRACRRLCLRLCRPWRTPRTA